MPPLTALVDLAEATRDALVAGWPAPPDAEPLPDRRYISNGTVIWDDCESLAVMVEATYGMEADPVLEQATAMGLGFAIRGAIIGVAIIRCVPDMDDDGHAPEASAVEESAAMILTDAMAVFNTLVAAQQNGQLATCNGLAFDRWASEGPQGGLGGGVLRFRAMLL